MKYKLITVLIFLAILLTACAKPAPSEPTEVAAETTEIETTEITTIATSTITTTETKMTTAEAELEKFAEKDIGGGYRIYATEKDGEYTLHLADENGETDSISLTAAEFSYYTILDWHPIFYDFDLPPCFSIYTYTGSVTELHYRTYFAIDGEIREAEWYLDGEKLETLSYSLLRCYGNGDSFNAYLPFEWDENYNWLDVTKCTFTFDEENLRFEGKSQCPITHEGTAKTAADALDLLTEFRWELRRCECSDEIIDDWYMEITTEGLRTYDEFMSRLREFYTEEAADEIFAALSEGEYSNYKVYDGKLYRIDSVPEPFTYMIVDKAWETDNGITAKIYSYAFSQDHPNYINPPVYVDFVQEDGVWKISSFSTERN